MDRFGYVQADGHRQAHERPSSVIEPLYRLLVPKELRDVSTHVASDLHWTVQHSIDADVLPHAHLDRLAREEGD